MLNNRRKRLFDDNYNIDRERRELRDMLDGDADPSDPRYPRYLELVRREEELIARNARTAHRSRAQEIVPDDEAAAIRAMPALASPKEDAMLLHTRDAYRLFVGRAADPAHHVPPIHGARYCAFALRNLWTLSNQNNPYADWALINIDAELEQVRALVKKHVDAHTDALDKVRAGGLELSVLESSRPQRTVLKFSSPYAYAIIRLLLDFDYLARLVRTLARRDILSDAAADEAIRVVRRPLRNVFANVIRFAAVLDHPSVKLHTRADYQAGANDSARKRIEVLTGIYGELPAAIFEGDIRPRHSKRSKLSLKPRSAPDAERDDRGSDTEGDEVAAATDPAPSDPRQPGEENLL
uniref:PFL_4669 family integrating conjugative element protein n=1 Tax=Burkholderia arboris TaxID=488730 RepID=UPI003BEEF03F